MLTRRALAALLLGLSIVQPLSAQDWEGRRWRHRDGLQVRIGKDYHLPADQVASGPIVVIGGSAVIDGRVEDDLVVIGGPVRIGPGAQIRADIVAIGGGVEVSQDAEVIGEVHDVAMLWPEIRFAVGDWVRGLDRGWWAAFTLAGTAFRFALVMLASCLVALVAPFWIRRVEERVAEAPLAAALVGVAVELLIVPMTLALVAILVLTLVGIPLLALLPFAMLAFVVGWVTGFAGVAAELGGRLRGRARLPDAGSTVGDVAWGVAALFLVTVVGNLLSFGPSLLWPLATAFNTAGLAIEYLAWTVGLGAVLLTPFRGRWGSTTPPPVPSAAAANA